MNPESRSIPEMVPLGLLRRYLTSHGWRLADSQSPVLAPFGAAAGADLPSRDFFLNRSSGKRSVDVYVLSEPGVDNVELVIPQDRSGSDFDRRMQGAIATLSQIEDKEPDQIIASVRSKGFDVVRSRSPDDLVVNDTIQLEQASNYINGMRELLAATATTEIKPLPFFAVYISGH